MIRVTDLGRMDYAGALAVQEEAVARRQAGGPDELILVEHDPVVTLGRHGGRENLLAAPEALAALGVDLVQTSRGGNITCHFPGQLVVYPIFGVSPSRGGLRGLFAGLEEAVIAVLAAYNVTGKRVAGRPGVFTARGKIASIGLAVRRLVTSHGLAFNVCRDLSLFSLITACGLADVAPVSLLGELDRLGLAPALGEREFFTDVKKRTLQALLGVFGKASGSSSGLA